MSSLETEIENATPDQLLAALARKYPARTKPMKRGVQVVVTIPRPEPVRALPAPVVQVVTPMMGPVAQRVATLERGRKRRGIDLA
jgi:uncharacterized protein YbjT (DUF2867 family)